MLSKLESKIYQVHLNGDSMSGRGVRFKLLSPPEKRKSDLLASQGLDKDATPMQYFQQRISEGVKTFLVSVTEQHSLKSLFEDGIVWRDVTYADLSTPGGDFFIDSGELFTAADVEILENLYRRHHEPSDRQIAQAMGEAKPVA